MTNISTWLLRVAVVVGAVAVSGCAATTEEDVGSTEAAASGSITLVRSYSGRSHWVSAWQGIGGAREEARYTIRASGDIALYSCWGGNHTFASVDPGCEGQPGRGRLGYLRASSGIPLYRCAYGYNQHFISTDGGCEGQRTEGLLGFVDAVGPGVAPSPWGPAGTGDGDGSGGGGGGGGGGVGVGGSL